MFAIFTQLARDEDMPRLEALDGWSLPFWSWRLRLTPPKRRTRAAGGVWAAHAPGARMRAILLVPIVLAALASAVFLGLGVRSVSRCRPAAWPQLTEPAPSSHDPVTAGQLGRCFGRTSCACSLGRPLDSRRAGQPVHANRRLVTTPSAMS
jgi:hypothetical protein